jgi:type V secretory pathway adhesin AidA
MRSFIRAIKTLAVISLAAVMLTAANSAASAQTGTVRLHIVKAGFIVGVGGGSGVLHYHGRNYRLSIGGIGIGSLGVAAVDLVGTASNLPNPGAIAGTYGGAGAGATFVGGGQVARLQNENGVVLELRGVQVGFQVSIGLGGMTIALR